jgi:hypothetical protein
MITKYKIFETSENKELLSMLKDRRIMYFSLEEALRIADTLIENGFRVFDYKGVGDDWNDWDCFIYESDMFVQSISKKQIPLSFEDFLKLISKKFKKIENSDVDPYGEEEWGYEEIKESKDIKYEVGDKCYYNPKLDVEQRCYRHKGELAIIVKILPESRYLIKFQNGEGFNTSEINLDGLLRKQISEDDPYGEEDWEITESNVNLRKFIKEINKYPTVVYHGTPVEHNFKSMGNIAEGTFFSTYKNLAVEYFDEYWTGSKCGKLYEVILKPDLNLFDTKNMEDCIKIINEFGQLEDCVDNYMGDDDYGYIIDTPEKLYNLGDTWFAIEEKNCLKWLSERYDGVILMESGIQTILIFNPVKEKIISFKEI